MMSDFSWLPGWALGCLAVVAALFALALLCMPFAVFGTKPRLQDLEFQIAEMRAELRALNLRLAVSLRPESVSVDPEGQSATTPVSRGAPVPEARVVTPSTARPDEDYLMPARSLRPDLPSYEDGPGAGDPETLPRRGRVSSPIAGEGGTGTSERVWSRAPWEQDASGSGRQPLGRGLDRKQPSRTVAVEDDAYRSRSEPKLRWPPRD